MFIIARLFSVNTSLYLTDVIYLFPMSVISEIEQSYKKKKLTAVRSGDTVRVHQKIKEGNKERVQIFEGLVIRTARLNSHTATIAVRRLASGVGVEKTFLLHSPLVTKVEVVKRSKVRRNYLSYMRARTGKSARLSSVDFNKDEVNAAEEVETEKDAAPKEESPQKKSDEAVNEKTTSDETTNDEKTEKPKDNTNKADDSEQSK